MPQLIQPLESLVNSPIRLSLAEPTDLVSPENIPRNLLIGEASAGTLSKRIHLPRIQPDKLIYLVGPAEDDSILTSWTVVEVEAWAVHTRVHRAISVLVAEEVCSPQSSCVT